MLSNTLLTCYLLIIWLTTIFTDFYTYMHIKLSSKQCSTTYHEENHSLKDVCKICHTLCNNQSINKQELDVPFKSTSFSYISLALICILSSLQNFGYSNKILYFCFFPIVGSILLFFIVTVNIPLIVCLSRKNNFENIAAARQRTNSLAWNRTHNQQWEMKCAIESRNSENVLQKLKSEEIIVESKKSRMCLETDL